MTLTFFLTRFGELYSALLSVSGCYKGLKQPSRNNGSKYRLTLSISPTLFLLTSCFCGKLAVRQSCCAMRHGMHAVLARLGFVMRSIPGMAAQVIKSQLDSFYKNCARCFWLSGEKCTAGHFYWRPWQSVTMEWRRMPNIVQCKVSTPYFLLSCPAVLFIQLQTGGGDNWGEVLFIRRINLIL